MTHHNHNHPCPLYQQGREQIHFCQLTQEGCPHFGTKKDCTAYHEINRQYQIMKKLHQHEREISALEQEVKEE